MSKGILQEKLKFPVSVYEKWNGYLGIVGLNRTTNELYTSSKALSKGEYAHHLRKMLRENISVKGNVEIHKYLKTNDVTLVFEVIDNHFDPHIIRYEESNLVLLAIVENTIMFKRKPFEEVVNLANKIGIPYADKVVELKNWEEFMEFYEREKKEDVFDFSINHVEGYVIEGNDGFMTKLKKPFYLYWKSIRNKMKKYYKIIDYEKAINEDKFDSEIEREIVLLGVKTYKELPDTQKFNMIKFMYSEELQELLNRETVQNT